ncbi:LSU ribosomal protein L19P [Fibrobacter sp. UWH9]|uniref:50S ribosomal protein L19 n=1 Tax=unclassified Fibrobacter TaxID=2634177 RepID=UPI00091D8475|nr:MULTISPECIES: 50S ribosomal protein L19 [Fibrobacter]MCQ2099351.1 50S ribosomal protein L19 [Fibrobacter sp.]MCL4101016.1 50S ribosomal protein L19 [Fibrobacter succinogenes]MDO4947029.1 50S ribosomal protein L19 [Fibrobacter sp.]OWV06939.1 50S ribosomal protein L19 [Fibrobacter sp. UWH3]OWV16178.1 50S ribosomal protein L19 [Fibrobacter sp. UWH1]
MSLNIEAIQNENVKTDLPAFRSGDTVTVNVKVIEGTKERIQPFKGVIIQVKNSGISKTITVRKMSNGVAVERIFPVNSPRIASILLDRPGKVRQARIYYMRDLRGKAARIDERQ